MLRYYGIAELAIVVSNVERSKRFYIDIVGFQPTQYDFGKRTCILKVGENRYMGLWEPGAWRSAFLSPERSAKYFGNAVAPTHPVFAIHQDDVPALAKRLTDAGYAIDGPMPHGDGSLHLYVSDPDNHALEFWGWRPGKEI
jgi:catechol 2,3-dioxygenase-like lactoylglutathione lyase family enzyme